jgi:hypothetical protein
MAPLMDRPEMGFGDIVGEQSGRRGCVQKPCYSDSDWVISFFH